ncbi:MAG: hypothetical protein AAGD25_21480 [Cyanobacteria bacterium P01_F01_bin.150]
MIQTSSTLWSRILSCIAIITAAAILTGCNETESPTASSPPAVSETVTDGKEEKIDESPVAIAPEGPLAETLAQDAEPLEGANLTNTTVSETGLGIARLGMTLGELKQALPDLEFSSQSPFIVDFDAIAVRQEQEVLFYILHLAGSPLADNDPIQGLLTDHPMFKTSDDVGVGTPLHAAEIPYGKAVLSYNTGNESREYVRFENHPATNISFGTQKHILSQNNASSSALAGIYDTPTPQYNETDVYQADAAIEAILIICLSATCSE